jgi:predicted deacylase
MLLLWVSSLTAQIKPFSFRQTTTAMGFNYVVQFSNEATLTVASVYCSSEAIKQGIPAVDIECGRLGMAETEMVEKIKTAFHHALMYLHIADGTCPNVNPCYIRQRTSVSSKHTGFFYSLVKASGFIQKGMTLGYVTDLFGKRLTNIKAPVNGIVLYMTATPPINKGDLFSIGHLN